MYTALMFPLNARCYVLTWRLLPTHLDNFWLCRQILVVENVSQE